MPALERIEAPVGMDLERIQHLLEQQSPGSRTLRAQELDTALRNGLFHLLLLRGDAGECLGMGSIFLQRNLAHWIAEIHDVVVDERHRGQGHGTAIVRGLLGIAQAFARERDTKIKLYLTSRPSRVEANRLYTDLGFRLVARAEGEWGTNLYKIIVEPSGLRSQS